MTSPIDITTPAPVTNSQPYSATRHDLGTFVNRCFDLVGGNPDKPEQVLHDVVCLSIRELDRLHEHVEGTGDGTDGIILRGIIARLEAAIELDGYELPVEVQS